MKRNSEILLSQISDIFKLRRPEITLVVVFQAGLMVLLDQIMLRSGMDPSRPATMPDWTMFVLGMGCMILAIVWQMLYLGFLRTAATDGAKPQEPNTLLRTGRPYFWQILGVQILLGLAVWVVSGVLAILIVSATGYKQAESFPPWLMTLMMTGAVALLVKPIFLIPSFMLVLDYKAIEAFAMMRQVRLSNLGLLPRFYGAGLAVMAVIGIVVSLAPKDGPVYYIALTAGHLLQSLTILTLMLATVLFIAIETERR